MNILSSRGHLGAFRPLESSRMINGMALCGKSAGFRTASAGFSLVEVALALGVMSISILVMLSLVPIGLSRYSDSRSQTRATDIATTIVADLSEAVRQSKLGERAAISPLLGLDPALNEQTLYFDQDGVLTSNASGTVYTASLTIAPPPSPPLSPAGITGSLKIQWLGGGKDKDAVTVFIGIAGE